MNQDKYIIEKRKTTKEYLNILEDEFLLFDTETTWFNKLNQMIEFWWIIYNKKIKKNLKSIQQIKKEVFEDNLLLNIVKFLSNDFLLKNSWLELLENLSKELVNNNTNKKNIIWNFIKEIKETDLININIENFEFILNNKITNYKLTYNKKVHFYFELYKDYVTETTYNVHHISNELLQQKWLPIERILKGLYDLLEWQVILAHNINFDITKIKEFFNDFKYNWPNIKMIIDTMDIFQVFNKEIKIESKVYSYSLDKLSKLYLWLDFKIENESAQDRHTAIFDVKLTYKNLLKIKNIIIDYIEYENLLKLELETIDDKIDTFLKEYKDNFLNELELIQKEEIIVFLENSIFNKLRLVEWNEIFFNKYIKLKTQFKEFLENQNIKNNNKHIDFFEKFKVTNNTLFDKYYDIINKKNKLINNLLKNTWKEEKSKKTKVSTNNLQLF